VVLLLLVAEIQWSMLVLVLIVCSGLLLWRWLHLCGGLGELLPKVQQSLLQCLCLQAKQVQLGLSCHT
jgi:hypothetical protein